MVDDGSEHAYDLPCHTDHRFVEESYVAALCSE